MTENQDQPNRESLPNDGVTRRQLLLTGAQMGRLAAAIAALMATSSRSPATPPPPPGECELPGYNQYWGMNQNCEVHHDCEKFACRGEVLDDFECESLFMCEDYFCEFSFDDEDCGTYFVCTGDYKDDDG